MGHESFLFKLHRLLALSVDWLLRLSLLGDWFHLCLSINSAFLAIQGWRAIWDCIVQLQVIRLIVFRCDVPQHVKLPIGYVEILLGNNWERCLETCVLLLIAVIFLKFLGQNFPTAGLSGLIDLSLLWVDLVRSLDRLVAGTRVCSNLLWIQLRWRLQAARNDYFHGVVLLNVLILRRDACY